MRVPNKTRFVLCSAVLRLEPRVVARLRLHNPLVNKQPYALARSHVKERERCHLSVGDRARCERIAREIYIINIAIMTFQGAASAIEHAASQLQRRDGERCTRECASKISVESY